MGGVTAAGCCTSMQRADTIARAMRLQNRVHAEPAMQSAASQVGAELLPIFPEEVYDCGSSFPWTSDCIQWNWTGGDARLVDPRGRMHYALPIHVPDGYYARLAFNGNDMILLVPKVTRREVDRRTQCECDGQPRSKPPGPLRVVFIVEGGAPSIIPQVEVPVTEDYVAFDCKN